MITHGLDTSAVVPAEDAVKIGVKGRLVPTPFLAPTAYRLQMTRHETYTLALVIDEDVPITADTVVYVECKNCEIEHQENPDPEAEGEETAWEPGGTVEFKIDKEGSAYTITPRAVNIRVTDPESDDINTTPRPGTEAPLKITAPQRVVVQTPSPHLETQPSGLGLEIPLGAARTPDGTYRSAGSLARYGAVDSSFASPAGFEFNVPSEFLPEPPAKPYIEVKNGSLNVIEKHFIGRDVVVRLWGGPGALTLDSATQSLVEVYAPENYNDTAHTFSGEAISSYAVTIAPSPAPSLIAAGVTLTQVNYGVLRSETIHASNDGRSTQHVRGPVTTITDLVIPTDPDTPEWYLYTTVKRDGEVTSSRNELWAIKRWGASLMESTVDPLTAGTDPLTTCYSYDVFGRQVVVKRPDDSWEFNEYEGLITRTYSPWLSATSLADTGGPGSLPASGLVRVRQVTLELGRRTTETFYKNLSSSGSGTTIAKSVSTWNKTTGRRVNTVFRDGTGDGEILEYALAYPVYPDEETPAWRAGRTIMTWDKSGRATLHGYQRGDWSGTVFTENSSGIYLCETVTAGVIASPSATSNVGHFSTVANHSTCSVTVTGPIGVVLEEERIVVASGPPLAAVSRFYQYETEPSVRDRPTGIKINGVWVARTDYTSELATKTYDDTGSWVERVVDEYGRLVSSTRSGEGDVPQVVTTYPVNGRTHSTTVASQIVSTETRDAAGRVKSRQDATGALTSYDYPDGGRTVTVTKPGGVTEITVREFDGRVKSITGNGVVPSCFSYDVIDGGLIKRTTRIGGDASLRLSSVTSNWDGSTAGTSKPGPPVPPPATAPPVEQTYRYAANTGQLLRIESSAAQVPDQVWSLDSSSDEGKLGMYSLSGTEIDGNGLVVNSNDRITRTSVRYAEFDGVWHRETVRDDYHDYAGTTAQAYTTTTREALKPIATTTPAGGLRWTTKVIRGGRTIETHRDCYFDLAEEKVITNDSATTGVSVDSVVTSFHGREISSIQYGSDSSGAETRTYDSSGRLASVKSPTGAKTIYGYNPAGQLLFTRDFLNQVTGYAYHPPGDPAAGRLWRSTNPKMEVTETSYDFLGRVTETTGNGTYRVKWSYNDYGEVSGMRTYRGGVAPDTGDLTEWTWDPASGVLNSKTDAAGRVTSYKYDAAGRVKKRTAPRSDGEDAVSNYSYTDFGDLAGIAYDDFVDEYVTPHATISTPSVAYASHDRLGRATSVTDGSGSRGIIYNSEGIGEIHYSSTSLLPNVEIAYQWTNLRYTGYSVDGGALAASYGYDDKGRIGTVTGSGKTHTYTWLPGTTIPEKVQSGSVMRRELSHDLSGRLRAITTRKGVSDSQILSRHGYLLDKAGRRSKAVRENGEAWAYGYNSRGEVTSGIKSFADNEGEIPGHHFSYVYDGIGNRLEAVEGGTGTEVDYGLPNELNQYTTVETEPARYIMGEAPTGDVFVNASSTPAVRAGGGDRFFWEKLDAANGSDPVWSHDTVSKAGSTSVEGDTFTPKEIVNPVYDWSGNLKSDGRWDYAWDAENRLIKMETAAIAYGAGVPRQKLDFVYDSQNRRVAKSMSALTGEGIFAHLLLIRTRFLYDDWNLIGEYSVAHAGTSITLKAVHTWGVDFSGTLQGAGGVGGLLSTELKSPATVCYPAYDGNGNISAWINGDGEVLERRDYSPFGKPIALHKFGSQSVLEKLHFGFSTKYSDQESGLLYYGYRYYDPTVGRWLSRDPIGERGGVNLYGFLSNQAIRSVEFLGMCKCGPDITEAFYDYLEEIEDRLNNLPADVVGWIDGVKKLKEIGGGIDFWYQGSVEGCATGEQCKGTVMFNDRCVRAQFMDNVLYGYIARELGVMEGAAREGANWAHMQDYGWDQNEELEQMGAYSVGYSLRRSRYDEGEIDRNKMNEAANSSVLDLDTAFFKAFETSAHAFKDCEACGSKVSLEDVTANGRVGDGFTKRDIPTYKNIDRSPGIRGK